MSCVRVRLQPDPTSEIERSNRGHDVERERDDLRPPQAEGRHEREICQETADRRPRRVGSIQQSDPPSAGIELAANEMSNQQRERSAHQHRDRRKQAGRKHDTRDV